jgi:membrane protein implicated in regulation of membrane protease activity
MNGPLDLADHWWWLILGVILSIAEIILPGVFLIWLGAAAVLTGLLTLVLPLPGAAQFAIFAGAAIVAVYSGRRWLRANPIESSDPMLNDRAARFIGETVLVVEAIEGGQGRVKVRDGVWNAEGPDTERGARVRVVGVNGSRLVVEPL